MLKLQKKTFFLARKDFQKKAKTPEYLKENITAKAKDRGENYISQTGKEIQAKTDNISDSLCKRENCKLKCYGKFDSETRKDILKTFHKLEVNAKMQCSIKTLQHSSTSSKVQIKL